MFTSLNVQCSMLNVKCFFLLFLLGCYSAGADDFGDIAATAQAMYTIRFMAMAKRA